MHLILLLKEKNTQNCLGGEEMTLAHQALIVVREQNWNQWESINYPATVGIMSFQSELSLTTAMFILGCV